MSFKILSDFDGVWTDQALEAQSVWLYMVAEVARLARVPSNTALAEFAAFERMARSRPSEFGWAPDGRITAYIDEDPFCVANSIAAYLDQADGEREAHYRQGVLDGGHGSLGAFADHCFHTATQNYRSLHPPALVPDAAEALAALHAKQIEVVVVSNSEPAKLIDWFRAAGVDAGEARHHALRVRGSAGKFVLGRSDASIAVGGRRIHVDRPKYRTIIEEEQPDLVIGDVFSLDLALPHAMRSEGAAGAPAQLVLRVHDHTPDWIRSTRADGAIDHLVDSVNELLGLAEGARA
jgi:phosphoglycolate phosphatase-like HAD superfamily hydrolase